MADPTLEARDRAAHKVARAAQTWEKAASFDEWLIPKSRHPEAWKAAKELGEALTAYEEAERRAQREATGKER